MHRAFSLKSIAAGLLLPVLLVAAHLAFIRFPNRVEFGPNEVELRLRPVALKAPARAPYRIAMAFRLAADDPRFGAVSGLAVDGGNLVAISDAGVVIRFAKPTQRDRRLRVSLRELPAGPGSATFKSGRDSEAIVRDPGGRGWWVAFERHDEVWLFDADFRRPLRRIAVREQDWHYNRGIEGLAASADRLWLFPEQGGAALEVGERVNRSVRLDGIGGGFPWSGWVAEAAMLPRDRVLLLERKLLPTGFANRLAIAEPSGQGLAVRRRYALALGPLDNVEALAVERTAGGDTRVWLMTDNDHRPFPQTLLMAIDLPAGSRP